MIAIHAEIAAIQATAHTRVQLHFRTKMLQKAMAP
jgi:hypothetical protein